MAMLSLFLPLAASAAAAGGNPDLVHVLDKLQRHYDSTASFSAKFTQEIAPVGAPKRERSGTVYFRKPGRMRWDFAGAEPETIVSDGTTLYNYDPGLNQVVEMPLVAALKSNGATAFILGMGNLRRDFKAALASAAADDGLIHLALEPKEGGYKIEVALDPKSYDLAAIRVTDQIGNATRIKFTDIHNNAALSDAIFAFKAPAGADIVTAPSAP